MNAPEALAWILGVAAGMTAMDVLLTRWLDRRSRRRRRPPHVRKIDGE